MSEVKVNKITPRTNCGTTTLGDSGDTINIPAGVTISNNGTATGFGATGAVNWDVASIKTVDFTAVSGVGYFVDTATTGAVEVTLPAAPAVGDVVGVSDYADNFGTANCTLNRNSLKIGGDAVNATLSTDGVAVTLVYVDVTKGWIVTDSGNQSDAPTAQYIAATGGCITTCGNYKIHTFLAPGTFTVCSVGNSEGSETVDYLVVAGGGGGGRGASNGAGAGAGGYRESPGQASGCYSVSPLGAAPAVALPVSVQGYPIAVGGGGAGGPLGGTGSQGCTSTFSTIDSAGGGGGGSYPAQNGGDGGSGGAAGGPGGTPGSGNTPPTNPAQGQNGGTSPTGNPQGGGGGATAAGTPGNPTPGNAAGPGGAGATSSINGTPTARAGGGGGGHDGGPAGGSGGTGGGGAGSTNNAPGGAGTVNTGGGGGGNGPQNGLGGTGGSGIVIIRYKYQ
jgi:hypothetical protein